MTDVDIRDALDRATRHLSPQPDLLGQVRRGGRRRLIHRRTVLGAGLAAVFGGSATTTLQLAGRHAAPDPTGLWLFDAPTRGDLAGDKHLLRRVRETWLAHRDSVAHHLQGTTTAPHVVWAGSTPVGPAAYVVHRTVTGRSGAPEGGQQVEGLTGFVESTATGLRVVDPRQPFDPATAHEITPAALIGVSLDVLVVIDYGRPAQYSTEVRYNSSGEVDRTFRPVPFADGAAVLRVPPQGRRITLSLLPDPVTPGLSVGLVNYLQILQLTGPAALFEDHLEERVLPGSDAAWPEGRAAAQDEAWRWRDAALASYDDVGRCGKTSTAIPQWRIRGATPDGRRLWVETLTTWDEPARVVAAIGRADGRPDIVYGGVMTPTSPLEVSLRLPRRQGVVVAAKDSSLRSRSGTGGWVRVVGDVALLPDSATEVEVTRNGRATRVSVR